MISIVLPIYKVEKYVGGCVSSIINQSVQDFELILVNDGTPDQSIEIAAKLLSESKVENYKIINTPNRGVSAARNTGMQAATGEFVIMVDSDDVLAPSFLEDVYRMIREHDESDIYSTAFSVVDENSARLFNQSASEITPLSPEEAVARFRSRQIKFLLPALVFRKSFLVSSRITFDENVRYSEDVQFIWRCLFYNTKPVIHLTKANYNYILHGNSTMTASGIDKILTGFEGLKKMAEELEKTVDRRTFEAVVCQMYFSLLHSAAKMLAYKNFHTLYVRAECKPKLRRIKDCDYRCRIVASLMRLNLRLGYYIMRSF